MFIKKDCSASHFNIRYLNKHAPI